MRERVAAGDRRTSPEATVPLTSRSAAAVVFLRMGSSAVTAKPLAGRWPAFRWPPGGLGALPQADEAELKQPRERPRTSSPRCLAGRVRAPGPRGGRKIHLRSAVRRPVPPAVPADLAESIRQLADPAARIRPTAPASGSPPCRDNSAYLRRGGDRASGGISASVAPETRRGRPLVQCPGRVDQGKSAFGVTAGPGVRRSRPWGAAGAVGVPSVGASARARCGVSRTYGFSATR
ncbi:hypothetical protein SAMN05442782_0623 [Streptomyces sp. OK228]|nr:hypothetical protein SAMN05442782_0623 [Streptomyces sp. OK228]